MAAPQGAAVTPAARRVLEAASELFYDHGINAVGVDLIAKRAGVTKKTLYDRYGSKDALVTAYLRRRDERWRAWLAEETERTAGDCGPAARILATFDALASWAVRESPRGCSFVNAAAELPDPDHPARAVIVGQKHWLRGYLLGLCRESGAAEPESLADELALMHEGANVMIGLGVLRDPVATVRLLAEQALEQAGIR